jgi:imidazoleglycerol-phosphate dehydratase
MAAAEEDGRRFQARVDVEGSGRAQVATGVPILDHLLGLLADRSGFDVWLEVAPGAATDEVAEAGRGLGEALGRELGGRDCRRHGSAVMPADEALAHVSLEYSGRPLLVSNVDLSDARVAGLDTDLVSRFLRELANGAGLTLHVRLIGGDEPEHVLESIFKALGVALARATHGRTEGP